MMFVMTSDIKVGGYSVKPTSVRWKCSVSNFTDTCTITLPLSLYVKTEGITTGNDENVKDIIFNEGMAVEISLGYDGQNTRRFAGFVNRINYTTPLSIECEGYSWQLRKIRITKSYKTTTAKDILLDLISGTDIKLSKAIPDLPLKNVWFKDCPGVKVLEWFQKECLCAVYFDFDTLYVGASKFGTDKGMEKLRLGWNTVQDNELKKSLSDSNIQINIVDKDSAGTVKRIKSAERKYSGIKEVKVRAGLPSDFLKKVAEDIQTSENYNGYQGCITCFLIPNFEKSMVAEISDMRFPDRNGKYFVETVEGSYDSSGGRQKLTLKNYGK